MFRVQVILGLDLCGENLRPKVIKLKSTVLSQSITEGSWPVSVLGPKGYLWDHQCCSYQQNSHQFKIYQIECQKVYDNLEVWDQFTGDGHCPPHFSTLQLAQISSCVVLRIAYWQYSIPFLFPLSQSSPLTTTSPWSINTLYLSSTLELQKESKVYH